MNIVIPPENTLDRAASLAAGWDPTSNEIPTYSFGELSKDLTEYKTFFNDLINNVANSEHNDLLSEIIDVDEPEDFPLINNPVEEEMLVIDPSKSSEIGLYPKAALWQSGWNNALPYVFVRKQVYDNLCNAVEIIKSLHEDLTLCVTDGWRSIEQQSDLYHSFYPEGHIEGEPVYVSKPNVQDRYAAPHPSGGAVDVLLGIKDQAIRIGSDLDYMEAQANTAHFENSDDYLVKSMRRIFTNIMTNVGFVCLDSEWWHFEYGTRRWAGKKKCEPLYGNAFIEQEVYENIKPVKHLAGSKRLYIDKVQ
ncbi:MAG: M15 family metallopeptidase [Acidimicrobiia bacterium]